MMLYTPDDTHLKEVIKQAILAKFVACSAGFKVVKTDRQTLKLFYSIDVFNY